jgi:TRAP-type C4-dicarboxylate transport system substrate-binding protein
MEMISQMGGSPTPIPWGELYTALQQGMVDGAENNPPSLFSSRHFEVTKHYSLDEHTRIPDIILFSQTIWDSMSDEQRTLVDAAAAESVDFQRKLWNQKTDEAIAELKKAGVSVYHPDKKAFFDQVKPMYDKLEGTPVGKLVKRIQETK